MSANRGEQGQVPGPPEPAASGRIADLSESERAMLREFAAQLRRRNVRNQVAREALDRAADELERAAVEPPG